MDKKQFISLMDENLKLIRTEYGLTQENMAQILGISKKTLVEIEKKRKSLGWTTAAALATFFSGSSILHHILGTDIPSFVIALAFRDMNVSYPMTLGGKVWWTTIREKNGLRIQQHVLSRHFRLLDSENHRIFSSFNMKDTEAMLESILKAQTLNYSTPSAPDY